MRQSLFCGLRLARSRPVSSPSQPTSTGGRAVATAPARSRARRDVATRLPGKPSAPAGYKAVERNGTTLYCTKVANLGTKFKQEVCMTQEEYDEVQRRGENMRQDLRKSVGICGGGTGPFACKGGEG